ncbi:MAG: SAM-dependent methyltransferase, partial [Rhodoferax sp.]|nr:SAM-dependent methyltransferase [Rhodoferax sp.]
MNTSTLSYPTALHHAPAAARSALKLLERLRHGSLTVQLPDGTIRVFGQATRDQGDAMIALRNWNMCAATLKSGDIGFAESYIAGDWSTPNLTDLLRLFIRNRNELEDVIYGSWAGRTLHRLRHWLNRNTRANSRKNIHAHYDLG